MHHDDDYTVEVPGSKSRGDNNMCSQNHSHGCQVEWAQWDKETALTVCHLNASSVTELFEEKETLHSTCVLLIQKPQDIQPVPKIKSS